MVLQEILERRTERSALLLRALLGKVRLEPVTREGGRLYYRALSNLQVLALLDIGPTPEDPEPGANSFQWWTRPQRIRTAGEMPFQAVLFEGSPPSGYQRIAREAKQLRSLNLSLAAIGRHLGVTEKTVAKALAWEKLSPNERPSGTID